MVFTKRIVNYISSYYSNLDVHKKEVATKSILALVLKLLAAVLGLGVNFLLARILNADGLGIYFLATTTVIVAGTLATFGLDNTFLRFTASLVERGDWSALKGLYEKGTAIVLASAVFTTLAIFWIAPWLAVDVFSKPELLIPLRMISLSIVPFAFSNIFAEMLKGLRYIFAASIVQGVAIPAFMVVGLMLTIEKNNMRVNTVIGLYIVATVVAGITGYLIWKKSLPQIKTVVGNFRTRTIFQSSFPLFLVTISNLIMNWSATFFLGIWATNSDVGVYGIASRVALRLAFIPVAVNSIAAPKFAALYEQGNLIELQRLAISTTKMMMITAAPVVVLLLIFPTKIMSFFGNEFVIGRNVLIILTIGQFINISTGLVRYLLIVSGHEKIVAFAFAISTGLTLALSIWLIPALGLIGASFVTASVLVVNGLVLVIMVKKVLGFWPVPNVFLWFSASDVKKLDN